MPSINALRDGTLWAGANSGASGGSAAAVDPAAGYAALPQSPGCWHQGAAVVGGARWRVHGSPAVSGVVAAPFGRPAHPVEGFLAPRRPRYRTTKDHQGNHTLKCPQMHRCRQQACSALPVLHCCCKTQEASVRCSLRAVWARCIWRDEARCMTRHVKGLCIAGPGAASDHSGVLQGQHIQAAAVQAAAGLCGHLPRGMGCSPSSAATAAREQQHCSCPGRGPVQRTL